MRRFGLIAAAITAATVLIYIGYLVRQDTPLNGVTVGLVTAMMIVLTALTAYGSLAAATERQARALWAAVPGFFGLGIIGLFSIGGLLLIAGLFATVAAVSVAGNLRLSAAGVAGWAVVVLVGWAIPIAILLWPAFS